MLQGLEPLERLVAKLRRDCSNISPEDAVPILLCYIILCIELRRLNRVPPPSDRPYRLSALENLLKIHRLIFPKIHGSLRDGSVHDVFKVCNAEDGCWSRIVVHIGTIDEKEASPPFGFSL